MDTKQQWVDDSGYERREYVSKLAAGNAYEEYVADRVKVLGMKLRPHLSKEDQLRGENAFGLEIKFDRLFRNTGNLYIELKEKGDPANKEYARSGIRRQDNTWLFGIGDLHTLWIFDVKVLRRLAEHKPSWLKWPKETGTSIGFCIPVRKADEFAALKLNWPISEQETA